VGGELQREDGGCGREKMVSETMSCEEKMVNVVERRRRVARRRW